MLLDKSRHVTCVCVCVCVCVCGGGCADRPVCLSEGWRGCHCGCLQTAHFPQIRQQTPNCDGILSPPNGAVVGALETMLPQICSGNYTRFLQLGKRMVDLCDF